MEGLYKIAEHTVRVISLHEKIHVMCRGYRVAEEAPEIVISTSQGDIDAERRKAEVEDRLEGIPVRRFADDYLETLAVYRKLTDALLTDDTILFHGSCVSVDGEGYLFTAKSGTGKSTHTRLWREAFGSRAVMVNDDKPLLKIRENGITAFGTPWDGKHRLSNNISVPLKAICILERGEQNELQRIAPKEAYPMLLQQANRPRDTQRMLKTLQLLDVLINAVGLYRLRCNMEPEAARIAFEGMNGKEA